MGYRIEPPGCLSAHPPQDISSCLVSSHFIFAHHLPRDKRRVISEFLQEVLQDLTTGTQALKDRRRKGYTLSTDMMENGLGKFPTEVVPEPREGEVMIKGFILPWKSQELLHTYGV